MSDIRLPLLLDEITSLFFSPHTPIPPRPNTPSRPNTCTHSTPPHTPTPQHPLPGRSLTLLDPTYASRFVPIIASVSEHQPPSWPSYITDLHAAALLAPAGLIGCFKNLTNGGLLAFGLPHSLLFLAF